MSQQAFKYTATINAQGHLELAVPLPPGTAVEVLILTPADDDLADLAAASGSSTDFWDNPLDNEDWNNA
jgi:hypothetical protein